jgi:arylsulfatase A-like enzyme
MIRRALTPLATSTALAGALLAAACSDGPAHDRAFHLRIGDYAAFQGAQVTTSEIDASWQPDPELEPGWSSPPAAGEKTTLLTLAERDALLDVFTAEVSERTLEIEADWEGGTEGLRLGLMLNGNRLEHLSPRPGRQIYSIPVSAATLRPGRNVLRLQPRSEALLADSSGATDFAIRRLRWLTTDGAPLRRGDPAASIIWSPDPDSRIEMPNDSVFDVVTPIPPRARLTGELRAALADGEGELTASVTISLLTSAGAEHELLSLAMAAGDRRSRRLDLPVAAAPGELARLRFEVRGPAAAVVTWRHLVLVGEPLPDSTLASNPPARSSATVAARPDVMVILLDAARADAFSIYDGPYPTPTVDSLAVGGTVFARALAPSSWTGQSVPALFTGRGANALGIAHWGNRLPPGVPTMAETLAAAGYQTTLWSQHPFYRAHDDLERGFSTVSLVGYGPFDREALAQHLAATPGPRFTFVHLLPPHAPYTPPAPFAGARSSWYRADVPFTAQFLNAFSFGRIEFDMKDGDLRYIRDRYQENVDYADSLVAGILSVVEDQGRYDDTLIVLLADHGEGFLEHGQFLHTSELYEEFVHVPLIVKWPAGYPGPGSRSEQPVSLLDLLPTLTDLLGIEDAGPFQGESLLAPPAGARAIHMTTRGDSSGNRRAAPRLALELDGWKGIYRPLSDSLELFDKREDPGESRDLAERFPLHAQFLRQEILRRLWLDRQLAQLGAAPEAEQALDAAAVEELRALGYLN